MNYTFNQLRIFLKISQTGSLANAAELSFTQTQNAHWFIGGPSFHSKHNCLKFRYLLFETVLRLLFLQRAIRKQSAGRLLQKLLSCI